MRAVGLIAAGLVGVLGCSSAQGAFMSSLESVSAGGSANGVEGWKGWDNVASSAGSVSSAFSFSGSNSLLVTGYTDAVQEFSGITSGAWSVTARQYIAAGQSGLTYFILMNKYADGANYDSGGWSTQLRFDLAAGRVYDDFRGGSLAIATGQWSEVRVDIDLLANTVKHYYNGSLLSSGSWTRSGSSALALAAMDLYSADCNFTYYDAVSVASVPTAGTGWLCVMLGVMPARRRRR